MSYNSCVENNNNSLIDKESQNNLNDELDKRSVYDVLKLFNLSEIYDLCIIFGGISCNIPDTIIHFLSFLS